MHQKLPNIIPFSLFILLFAWITIGYLLPLCLPFLLGAALALAAEPAVRFLSHTWKLPRQAGSAIAVSGMFVFGISVLVRILAILGQQMKKMAAVLPAMVKPITL